MSETRASHDPGGRWEVIGPLECPILFRRTLFSGRLGKILLHRFVPNAADKDPHDHPSSFLTIVLRGSYYDQQPDGSGEWLYAPTFRYRRAEHAHITKVGPKGAFTVCIMFRKRRPWGFWREGKWFEWSRYERLFGLNWRCDD